MMCSSLKIKASDLDGLELGRWYAYRHHRDGNWLQVRFSVDSEGYLLYTHMINMECRYRAYAKWFEHGECWYNLHKTPSRKVCTRQRYEDVVF